MVWHGVDGEDRFWKRLHGSDEFSSGSTLRLLRQDALTKNWVCFMKETKTGGTKPQQYTVGSKKRKTPAAHQQPEHDDKCPFCIGREGDTEVLRVWPTGELTEREGAPDNAEDKPKWLVRVLRNPFPYLLTPPDLYATAFPGDKKKHAACFGDNSNLDSNPDFQHPLYRCVDGVGASEVVVESPCHNALIGISTDEQVYHSLRAIAARGRTLRKSPYVFQLAYFKQYGADAGGSLIHPHMQVCSLPIVSQTMQTKLKEQRDFYEEHGCSAVQKLYVEDVIGGHSLAVSRLLRQSEHFVASIPFAQVARGRIVIAPKRMRSRFEDCTDEELSDLAALLRSLMAALYRVKDDPSYNLFWESAPTEQALQGLGEREAVEKTFSWTLNIRVPPSISGFGLASGCEVTRQLPEEEARDLREALLNEARFPIRRELLGDAAEGAAAARERAANKKEFPDALGPFMMIQVDLARAYNAFHKRHNLLNPDPDSDRPFNAGFDLRAAGLEDSHEVVVHLSPIHCVTLTAKVKAAACIPSGAAYFAWAYPLVQDAVFQQLGGSERAFLKGGGFVYFNDVWDAVGTTTISPADAGTSFVFGGPQDLPSVVANVLEEDGRFQAITKEAFKRKGATHYAWLRPMEFDGEVQCPHGGFAYKFVTGSQRYFALERSS